MHAAFVVHLDHTQKLAFTLLLVFQTESINLFSLLCCNISLHYVRSLLLVSSLLQSTSYEISTFLVTTVHDVLNACSVCGTLHAQKLAFTFHLHFIYITFTYLWLVFQTKSSISN